MIDRCIAIGLVLLCCYTAAQDSGRVGQPVAGKSVAELALAYTGFDRLAGASEMKTVGPRLMYCETDSTPVIRHWIEGRHVWLTEYRHVVIPYEDLDSALWPKYARDFTVWQDSATGKLLKITSTSTSCRYEYVPRRPAQDIEKDYETIRFSYVDMPEQLPIALAEVLAGWRHEAHQIEAKYVLQKATHYEQPLAVWVVSYWGIAPVDFSGPGADEIPAPERSSEQISADVNTGEIMSGKTPAD